MTSDRTAPIEQRCRTDDRGLVTDGGPRTDAPTVTVSRLVTRRGKRASVSVPAFDQSVSLDAIALESLTDQDEATDPIEALRPRIEGPGTDAEPTLSMAEDTIRIVNEYSEAVLTSVADGLRITSPPTGHSVVLHPRHVFDLAFLEDTYAFTALLADPVTLEENIGAMQSAFE